jgi:hypothetical protein
MRASARRIAALAGGLAACSLTALGCDHTQPFATVPPDTVGPFTAGLPRQLTFNPLSDETPSVHGDTLVFTRLEASRPDRDRCLALLPVEGGRLLRESCPRGALSDSTRESWLYPAISPDGSRIAFVRERGTLRGAPEDRALVVAPLDRPDSAVSVVRGVFPTPSGVLGNAFQKITWRTPDTLWFLGGVESLSHGNLGGFAPLGVFQIAADADPATTPPSAIPELATAVAYDSGNDGSVYFLSAPDSTAIYRWVPGLPPTPLAQIGVASDGSTPQLLTDVAFTDSLVAVIGIFGYPDGTTQARVTWIDLAAGGTQHDVYAVVAVLRLAAVRGRPLVVLEAGTTDSNLWRVTSPGRSGYRHRVVRWVDAARKSHYALR